MILNWEMLFSLLMTMDQEARFNNSISEWGGEKVIFGRKAKGTMKH